MVNYNSYAKVPSSIQRTARYSAISFYFERLVFVVSTNFDRWLVDCNSNAKNFTSTQLFHHGSWSCQSCPTIAYRWLFPDSQVSMKTSCSAVINSPKFCCSRYGFTCASRAESPSSSGPPALRKFGLSGSECEFFSCYIFPHGNSSGNGFPRACSSSCDWVCHKSPCACSLILSHRIVAGHTITFS